MNRIKRIITIILTLTLTIGLITVAPAEAASVKAPAKVKKFKSPVQTVSSIKLTWKKAAHVKGYQIYRKAPNAKKWKKVATVKSSKNTYVNSGLQANTKYKYKVRAYRTYKSKGKKKKMYGKFSKVITVKTKRILATLTLKDGYYTAGVDIPAGTFDVIAIAGAGYILSDVDSANLRGPEYNKGDFYDFDSYSRTYTNYRLPKGNILEVSGVQVKIMYGKVTAKANPRRYDTTAGIMLTPGNYVVGKDIAVGRYCVKYISGEGGYVSSDRSEGDCILSSNMDGDPKSGEYTDYVSNVLLKKGEIIEVTSGLTVLFIPEKKAGI